MCCLQLGGWGRLGGFRGEKRCKASLSAKGLLRPVPPGANPRRRGQGGWQNRGQDPASVTGAECSPSQSILHGVIQEDLPMEELQSFNSSGQDWNVSGFLSHEHGCDLSWGGAPDYSEGKVVLLSATSEIATTAKPSQALDTWTMSALEVCKKVQPTQNQY